MIKKKQKKVIEIFKKTRIKTLQLVTKNDGKSIIFGHQNCSSSFIKTSEIGVCAIELMNKGYCLEEVQKILSEKYGQKISVKNLIRTLYDANLIEAIDEKPLRLSNQKSNFPKLLFLKMSRFFFSKIAYTLYATIFCFAIICVVNNPTLFTNFIDSMGNDYLVYTIAAFFVGWLFMLKHEFFHYLAALSLGIPATIQFGTRYILLVMETDVSGLYMIDKSKRYRVYLAGVLSDLVTISFLICIKLCFVITKIQIDLVFFDIAIMVSLFGILFQLNIFLKTDFYLVLTELFNIENLYINSDIFIKSILHFRVFKNREEIRKTVIIFSIFRMINYMILTAVFLLFIIGLIMLYTEQKLTVNILSAFNFSHVSIIFYFTIFIIVKLHQIKQKKPMLIISF